MLKKVAFVLLFALCVCFNSSAEVIENIVKEEKNFGDWKVLCTEDVMMGEVGCKAFTKFYNNLATIYIQPYNKIANQVVIIVPPALSGTVTQVRIDRNEIMRSQALAQENYGVIPFSSRDQKLMLQQMKDGRNFFIRFMIKGKDAVKNEEITVKIPLEGFEEMLIFYDEKLAKD